MEDVTSPDLGTPKNSEGISYLDLAATLLRHKKMIFWSSMGAIILTVFFSVGSLLLPPEKSYLPNLYMPQAILLVNNQDSGGLSSMLASSGLSNLAGIAGISTGGGSYGELAVAIAKSNTIIDALVDKYRLVERYKIKKSPRTESRRVFLKNYSAIYDEKTGLISISFEERDPVLAKNIVNDAVDLLDHRFITIGGNRNIVKRDQLEAKLADVQVEMTRLEGQIQAFQQKHGVLTVESVATEQVSTVAQVRSQLMMKEMEIKTYGDISKVHDPALLRLIAERDNLSKLLDELEKGFSQYEKTLPSQKELPKLAIDFSHLERDLAVQEKIFELLTQQLELTKLEISGSDPIIQILEQAEVPDKKSGPSRGIICIVVTMTALFISILAAFIIEAIKKVMADPVALSKLKDSKK